MNYHDLNNLRFLIESTPEELAKWRASATPDDLVYAQELFDMAAVELIDVAVSKMTTYPLAQQVVDDIKSGKLKKPS
jgi:hypothetical protein